VNCGKKLVWSAIFFLALLRFFTLSAYSKDIKIASQWVTEPIKIDGKISDWPEGSMSLLEDVEMTIGLCNDSEKAYLVMYFRKPEWAQLIKMSGLTIWLDTQGKKHKDFMIRLTGGLSANQIMAASPNGASTKMPAPAMDRMGKDMEEKKTELIYFQKNYLAEKVIPLDGTQGPAAAFGVDKGFFIYEFSIPFKKSEVLSYGLGIAPGKLIDLGLIWGEMDKKSREEKPEMGGGGMDGGGPPGGMGGGPGGGRGGGPGGFGGPGREKASEKQEIWLKAQIVGFAPTESIKAVEKKEIE
jgi:hypothetical protein